MEELISVVVPVYNVKDYLDRCVNSIINQTYKNLEIILVDDGSNDGSEKICDEYEKKYANIKTIYKINGGLSDARNKGIENANGKYILFIDSDDFVNKKMIEILYNNLIQTNSDISVCRPYIFSNEKEIKEYDISQNLAIYEGLDILKTMYNDYLVTVVAWNKLYKKEIFDNIRYPVGKVIEDSAILHYILTSIKRICYSNLELYYYFQRESSIMHKTSYKLLDELDFLNDRIIYFKKCGYENENFFIETIEKYFYTFNYWMYLITKDNGYNKKIMSPYFKQCENVLKENEKILKDNHKKLKFLLKYKSIYLYIKGFRNLCRKISNKIYYTLDLQKFKKEYKKYIAQTQNKKKYLIFNAPNHGNIGDHAILDAEEEFLNKNGCEAFSIISHNTEYFLQNFSETIKKDDVIMITGGGNLGTLWEHEQVNVNKVLEKYKNNSIIIFPQTVYYSNDFHGKYRLELDKSIYKSCKDLKFVCRDSKSFDFVKNVLELNCLQTSDIVTYLNYSNKINNTRKGILICLRKDKEKVTNSDDIEKIINYIKENYSKEKLHYVDTVFKGKFSLKKGKKYLNRFLNKTKKSKLFITDRLHGMIFATITGTPCIAMNNSSGKVKGVYKWISQSNNFVKFVENYDDFVQKINELDLNKTNIYKNEDIKLNFDKILK